MTKRSLTKGGVLSNLDLTMDPAKRAEALKDERAAALVEEAIKESDARGGDSFGVATAGEVASGFKFDETKFHKKSDRERGQEWTPPLGVVVDPTKDGGWGWAVDESTALAMQQGYRCPNCSRPTEPDKNVCTWPDARVAGIGGCGYSFTLDRVIGVEAAEQMRGPRV